MLFEVETATPPPNNPKLTPRPHPIFGILKPESHSSILNPKPQTLNQVGGPHRTPPLPFKTKGAGWFDNSVHIAQQVMRYPLDDDST